MDPLTELRIEIKRLSRHLNYLEKRFSPSVARDLASNLRNIQEMSNVIDDLCKKHDWRLQFEKQVKTKATKRMREGSDQFPLSGSLNTKTGGISDVAFYNRALSPEEIKALSTAPKFQTSTMTFGQWLGLSAWEFKIDGVSRSIPRSEFIDRCANRLGGSHPISIAYPEKEHWADNYIIELLRTSIAHLPAPYAILVESGQAIIKAFKPYV